MMWRTASTWFSKQAKGEVGAFAEGALPMRTYMRYEIKQLLDASGVIKIKHFDTQ